MDPGACQKETIHRDEEGMHLMTVATLQVGYHKFMYRHNNSTHNIRNVMEVLQAKFWLIKIIVFPKHFMG